MRQAVHPDLRRRSLLLVGALLPLLPRMGRAADAAAPALMLAQVYRPGIDLSPYWLSEKYDGVRGHWDGQRLLTRGGHVVNAPAWFTAGWPAEPMDGELWAGRGGFETALSTVRQQRPNEQAWRGIRFMVFDLPTHPGVFSERIAAYTERVQALDQPWVQAVLQERVASHTDLLKRLDRVVRAGGEGLMLHRGDALYRAERSQALLKVKTHEDAEARVMAHLPGQGKYAGLLGALLVESADGRRFRIGSGFSDTLRREPPALGTWITYRFRGLHESGLPRFATYLRVRSDTDLNPPEPLSR
ncbi:MAG: DNA ligase [Comamonadaceae bacterium]|nr:DNA ligase [Comamonadaceae bacterium]